ncbi:LAGLIDADG family homing endonuclease [Nanoarchaeota archaeon]
MTLENLSDKKFISNDMAYWIGVAQSDAYFKRQFVKSIGVLRYQIALRVGEKSLPMQKKFEQISQKLFNIKGSNFKTLNENIFPAYEYSFGCKNLLPVFRKLNINFIEPIPPDWILNSPKLFGAYLAGIIDGDGDVRISNKKYPQCKIRISNKNKPIQLIESLKKILKCGVNNHIRIKESKLAERKFIGRCSITEFSISKKNYQYLYENVINHLALIYKKDKIMDSIWMKRAVAGTFNC